MYLEYKARVLLCRYEFSPLTNISQFELERLSDELVERSLCVKELKPRDDFFLFVLQKMTEIAVSVTLALMRTRNQQIALEQQQLAAHVQFKSCHLKGLLT